MGVVVGSSWFQLMHLIMDKLLLQFGEMILLPLKIDGAEDEALIMKFVDGTCISIFNPTLFTVIMLILIFHTTNGIILQGFEIESSCYL